MEANDGPRLYSGKGGDVPQKEIVQPSGMATPTAPFSLATKYGNLVFVAGLAVYNPQTGRADGDIRDQTRSTLERIQGVLAGAGTTMDNVLSATCFLATLHGQRAHRYLLYNEQERLRRF